MTLQEYLATPETVLPVELAHGHLRVADAPLAPHQRAVAAFFRALDTHVRARTLGEVWLAPLDVVLDVPGALVVQPDLLFVSTERSRIVQDRVYGAPDMVLEVLSPQPRVGRLEEHLRWFARYGVRECWLFHQLQHRLEILTFDRGRVAQRASLEGPAPIRSGVFPDLACSLGAIVGW